MDGLGYCGSSIVLLTSGAIIDSPLQWHGQIALSAVLCVIAAAFMNWYLFMHDKAFPGSQARFREIIPDQHEMASPTVQVCVILLFRLKKIYDFMLQIIEAFCFMLRYN